MKSDVNEHVVKELARELEGYKQGMANELKTHYLSCYSIFRKCCSRYTEVESYHESVAHAKEVLEKAINSPEMKFWKRGLHPGDKEIYENKYNALIQRYVNGVITYAKRAMQEVYAIELGYDKEQSQYYKPNYKILHSVEYHMGYYFTKTEKDAVTYIKRTVTDIVKKEYAKLESTFLRHYGSEDIRNITLMSICSGVKGKEAILLITFNNEETETVKMEAIPAGGYNIQSFHYRYILKVTKPRSK